MTFQAIWGTMHGQGPFLTQTPTENATALQLFLLVTATPLMLLAVVIETERRTQQALRRAYEQNQDLAGRLIRAQEVERTRMARDLHDDVSQQLAGVAIMLSGLKRRVAGLNAEPDIDRTVTTLQSRTSALAQSVRTLSHELHPGVLAHTGLVATLRRHCDDVEQLHHIIVTFAAEDEVKSLRPDAALCLFRVAQEALTNAVRHGQPRTIHVQLMVTPECVELRVVDDGHGFVTAARAESGLGLRSIEERVRLVRGSVELASQPGQGTRLLVRVPYVEDTVGAVVEI
jgi:two-component system sensor histidine kinase UhpB